MTLLVLNNPAQLFFKISVFTKETDRNIWANSLGSDQTTQLFAKQK